MRKYGDTLPSTNHGFRFIFFLPFSIITIIFFPFFFRSEDEHKNSNASRAALQIFNTGFSKIFSQGFMSLFFSGMDNEKGGAGLASVRWVRSHISTANHQSTTGPVTADQFRAI